ncbi:MAG TPA: diacylglycerol kinase family protein, partial [Chryseosolibacter sp.]|nr:diacylglycerol kinase family protein [Chryseosolibacter sp.]
MNEFKKVLFIINKFSGGKYFSGLEQKIIDASSASDTEATIAFTEARGHATELARNAQASGAYSAVIAVGGDGTVNEVANGMIGGSTPMGIVPKGSGNGLARHLGIPLDLHRAVDAIFACQPIDMDTFRLNGKLSLNVSGIGFDGHVANLFGKEKHRGLPGYTRITVSQFLHFKEFMATIKAGDQAQERKTFIIAIANSSQYGNNARIAPAASVCDGILHVCFLKKVPPYRLDFIYSFFAGTIGKTSYCEIIEARDITIAL